MSSISVKFIVIYALLTLSILLTAPARAQETHKGEVVILVHGFMGSAKDMQHIQRRLEFEGYETYAPDYSSVNTSIDTLSLNVIQEVLEASAQAEKIHFVTHSMGGILLRGYLENHEMKRLSRVVMLGPPNHGSEVASTLAKYGAYRRFFGPAGTELGNITLHPYKIGDYELGIIAGNARVNPLFSDVLPGPDDGYVSVESTRLEGMNDFIVAPSSHGLLTANEDVISQVVYFLEAGRFNHDAEIGGFPLEYDRYNWFHDAE